MRDLPRLAVRLGQAALDQPDTLGDGDCEALHPGWLGQPVNTLTSLAYVGAGGWLASRVSRLPKGTRSGAVAYAALVALTGAGSVAYHGPQFPGAQFLHDSPIVGVAAIGIAVPLTRLARHRPPLPGWSTPLGVGLAVTTAAAGAAYLGGGTASTWCRPDSWLQLHGLWHAGTAAAVGMWGAALWAPAPADADTHAGDTHPADGAEPAGGTEPAPPTGAGPFGMSMLIGQAGETPGVWRKHPVVRRLVDAVAWVTWREVAIDDLGATAHGPVVLVANHFGGVSDAIVLMSVLPRRPRILADDAIWNVPVAKQVMEWIGAIPVHRGHRGTTDNRDMFASAHDALADGELVLIFPEGITREEPSIGEVRSGAARIAIGARAAGVRHVQIVPVGIHYSDKAAFRSVVYVREGEPIDLDHEIAAAPRPALDRPFDPAAQVGPAEQIAQVEQIAQSEKIAHAEQAEHAEVDRLTALIAERLRASAPDYDDWREARALQMAAEVFLRSLEPDEPVPVGLRDRMGAWLAERPDHSRIEDVADAYRTALTQVGATDAWAGHADARLSRRRLFTAITWLLMVPYALMGVVAWAVPSVLTWLVSRLRLAPAVMATVLPIVALALFGLTTVGWVWVGWTRAESSGVVTALIVLPITFAALGLVLERGLLWVRWIRNRLTTLGGRGRRLGDLRADVVAAVADEVAAALAPTAHTPPRPTGDGAS